MRKLIFLAVCLAALAAPMAWGQAMPTASRAGDLQVGGGFAFAPVPDYGGYTFKGYAIYADFDFKTHFGVEAAFHQVNEGDQGGPLERMYERTYEIGGRYVRHYGRFAPYAKAMIGRGVFNFPLTYPGAQPTDPHANLAFNIYAFGGGIDYHLTHSINIRGDYEFQFWPGFPPRGLSPQVATIGAAYHFH